MKITKEPHYPEENEQLAEMGFEIKIHPPKWRDSDNWQGVKWVVRLSLGHNTIKIEYTKGSGHYCPQGWRKDARFAHLGTVEEVAMHHAKRGYGKPELAEVVHALYMDTSYFIGQHCTFENFCDELGLNPDSRKDLKLYEECQSMFERSQWIDWDKVQPIIEDV